MTTDTPIANPTGLNLVTMAQQALANYVTELVRYEVTKAMLDAKTGSLAAVLLDESLNDRIRDVVADMNLATETYVDTQINEHNDVYDHDEFASKGYVDDQATKHTGNYDHEEFAARDGVKDMVERVLEDISVSLTIN